MLPSFVLRHRRNLTRWVLGLWLLAQAVVAAHACLPSPRGLDVATGAHPASLSLEVGDPAPLCPGHVLPEVSSPGQASEDAERWLCEAHCDPADPLPGSSEGYDGQDLQPQAGHGHVAPVLQASATVGPRKGLLPAPAPPPGWPPLYLCQRVLRN